MRGRDPVQDSGCILTERDIADPVDLVLDGPVAADVAGQVAGGGLAGVEAGDDEYRDGGLDGLLHPALALPDPHGPGDVPLDEGDLAGVREPLGDVRGGVHDLDGAALAPPVASFLGGVLDRDGFPVQGVEFGPQGRGVLLDGENIVRQEFLADERRVGADGVPGVGGDDVPGQRVVPVQFPQQRRELRDLVGLRADQPLGQHAPGAVGGGGQQVRDEAVRQAARRNALPSAATAGSQPGPATGNATGPGCARRARYAPA